MRSARHGCVVLIGTISWVLGGCGVDSPETITGPAEKESGWVVSSAQLLHPDGLKGGGAVYIFDRSTFRRVNRSEVSREGLYVIGVVTADSQVFWGEEFRLGAKKFRLIPFAAPPAAKKIATTVLRGDFDGSGQVDQTDVVFLFAWLAAQVEFPDTQLEAGDIDDDGDTDWMDLALLGAYAYADPRPSANPHGIGLPLAEPLSARIVPDPSTFDFAEKGKFYRFQLFISGGEPGERLRIYVNDTLDDRMLEISSYRRSSTTCRYLGDRRSIAKLNRGVFYLARCGYGESRVAVFDGTWRTDERGNPQALAEYEVTAEAPVEATEFNIDLVFMDGGALDHRERHQVELAAQRWESIITGDIEDFSLAGYIKTFTPWWGGQITLPDAIDDIRIYVGILDEPESRTLAWGGPGAIRGRRDSDVDTYLPAVGLMAFNRSKLDEIERLNGFYGISLHEMGHCMGFTSTGLGSERLDLIRNPSVDNVRADVHFAGVNAIRAFNRLGGLNYRGAKVPLQRGDDSHWRWSVFRNEIMDPDAGIGEYLSEITIGAFEDMGYEVDYAAADDYRLPARAKLAVTLKHEAPFCQVLPPIEFLGPKEPR